MILRLHFLQVPRFTKVVLLEHGKFIQKATYRSSNSLKSLKALTWARIPHWPQSITVAVHYSDHLLIDSQSLKKKEQFEMLNGKRNCVWIFTASITSTRCRIVVSLQETRENHSLHRPRPLTSPHIRRVFARVFDRNTTLTHEEYLILLWPWSSLHDFQSAIWISLSWWCCVQLIQGDSRFSLLIKKSDKG